MLVIGHRGALARAPENTLASFAAALEAGVDGIEFDVRLTADGHPVLMHDDEVSRTTDGAGRISDMTLEEIRRLDAAARFDGWKAREPVPTLEEALAAIPAPVPLIVELKGAILPDEYRSAVPAARAVAARAGGRGNMIVSSFEPEAVAEARRSLPDVPTAYTGYLPDLVLETAVAGGHVECHIPQQLIEPAFVARAHEAGLRVLGWSVNDAARARELAAMGADGVFTDDPLVVLRALDRA